MLQLVVGIWFQNLFHSHHWVLFTFPSRYYFAIGDWYVFRLTAWSRWFPTRFHVPRRTQDTIRYKSDFVYGAVTLYCVASQLLLLSDLIPCYSPITPDKSGLVCSAFARRYLRNLFWFLFPCYLDGSLHTVWPCHSILFKCAVYTLQYMDYSIRLFATLRIFAPPRNFSQLITTFFAL